MLNASLFKKGSTVAVALSGGKDSVCLLNLLIENAAALFITVKAVNVEHGIRGETSVRDTEFVKNLCAKKGVPLLCYAVNAPKRAEMLGESLEQAARALRYECFLKAISGGFCDFIATAHHQSDNAETVLLNLIRGTSLKGLCGISETALNGKIIRPLLSVSRADIDDYVRAQNLEYVTDETNFSTDYSRNYLRNEIIPQIVKKFPHFERAVSRMCETLKNDDDTLDFYAEKLIGYQSDGSVKISTDLLFGCGQTKTENREKSIFMRACLIALKNLGFVADYTSAHLNALYNLCFLQTGASADLKNGIKAYKEQYFIIFVANKQKSEAISPLSALSLKKGDLLKAQKIGFNGYEIEFVQADRSEFESKKNTAKTPPENAPSRGELFFDFDKLPDETELRLRKTGDEILSFGGKNKNLKKYFTDKKIPARVSNELPLVAKGEKIYLVSKVDVSDLLKIDETTANIVKFMCYKKGEEPTDV